MTQGPSKQDIGNQINDSANKAVPADPDKLGFWDTTGLRLVYVTFLQLVAWIESKLYPMSMTNIALPKIGSVSTYLTARDDLTVRGSAGVIDGDYAFIVANPGAGTHHVDVGVGDGGYLRTTNDPQGDLVRTIWIGATGSEIPNPATGAVTIRFFGVSYLAGTPQVVVSATYNWNFNTTFPLGSVTWDGTTLRILNEPAIVGDVESLTQQQMRNTQSFQRENAPGSPDGLIISDVATRQIAMTAGVLWRDINNYVISAIAAGTAFYTHYQRSGGGFNSTSGVTQWPNTQYDDGSGTLATMAAGKYACLFVFLDVSELALNVMYGRAEYDSVAEAQAEEPSTTPNNLTYQGVFIGTIIFQKSASSAALVESAWIHAQTQVEVGVYGADYGDGSDGAAVLDGTNLYPWVKLNSANVYELLRSPFLTTLSVSNGVTVKMTYPIFAKTSMEISGLMDCKGGNAAGAIVGTDSPVGFWTAGMTPGAGIASGGAAADGTPPTASTGLLVGGIGGRGAGAWASAILRRGKNGYNTNLWWPVLSGSAYVIRRLEWLLSKYLYNTSTGGLNVITPSQGGGGGAKSAVGTSCSSGGGGAGGGVQFLASPIISVTATGVISSDGGVGGAAAGTGANSGGGGGGGGGVVGLLYNTLSNLGSISAAGGLGGASVALGSTPTRAMAIAFANSATLTTSQGGVASAALRLTGSNNGGAKDTLYILALYQSGGTLQDPVVDGYGLTWTKIDHVDFNTIASPTHRLVVFYAYGTPSFYGDTWGDNSSSITITYAATLPTVVVASIYEIQNTTNTIVQSAKNSSNSATTLTVTLAAVGSTNSAIIGVFAKNNNAAPTAGAGFSLVGSFTSGTQNLSSEMSYNDTTVDASWVGATAVGALAFEVAEIGAMESGVSGMDGQIIHFVNKQ